LTLLSPGALAIVFVVCALWVWLSPRSSAARRTMLAAAVFYLAASTYRVPAAIASLTLARHADPFRSEAVDHGPTVITLLGGGHVHVEGLAGTMSVMLPAEAARVLEAARVFHLVRAQWVISSGGALPGNTPSSLVMRDALVQLGVPSQQILLESSSRDTHEEAVLIAPMLRSLGAQRTIVVTSSIHMPRSLGAFRAAGIRAIPAPVREPETSVTRAGAWLPSASGLLFSSQLAHEFIGIAYYRARGWWIR
jgi:uncharacterized SAM-binding protein YcdF (DUF218 family)